MTFLLHGGPHHGTYADGLPRGYRMARDETPADILGGLIDVDHGVWRPLDAHRPFGG